MIRALLASVIVLGCTEPKKPGPDDPFPCQTDKDCPPIACGPCTPGTVLTEGNSGRSCVRNPCKPGGAVCGADKVCVVRPDAKAIPPRDDANAK